jgi:ribonuclease P protein subunit POP4
VQTSLCAKLTKADFSGAKVKIVNAKNSELIGTEGIVIRETTRTFVIVQVGDVVRVLLKEGTVFQF